MFRRFLVLATACGTCLATSGEAGAACTRATLQGVVDRYIASQAMGDPQSLPILANAPYVEQNRAAVLQKGILAQPMKVEFSHSLLDVRQCQTFTELAVVDPAHPYVIGTQLAVDEDVITAMRTLVAGATNGPVDADNWVRRISKEDWGVLPREQRVDRATLIAAADAYLDALNDPGTAVPWGTPCRRLEAGAISGTGADDDRCDIGRPQGVKATDRSYVVDEQLGAVAALVSVGHPAQGGSYLLRLVDGRIRLVHVLSAAR